MSNSYLKMQEKIWAELDYRIEEQYQGLMYNCLYKGKRITKFNFEEVAKDNDFIMHWFNYIVDKMYSIFYFKLTADEIAELKGYTMDKLYELLKTDRQDLRKEKQCQKK